MADRALRGTYRLARGGVADGTVRFPGPGWSSPNDRSGDSRRVKLSGSPKMPIGNSFDVGFVATAPAWDQEPWTTYYASHQIKAAPSGDESTSFA